MLSTNGNAARNYAAQGFKVFPCQPTKQPYTSNGFHAASADPAQIDEWWSRWPNALVGLPTGQVNGVVVVDIDTKEGKQGEASWKGVLAEAGFADDDEAYPDGSLMLRTQSGGRHLWFAVAPEHEIPNSASAIGEHIDIRGDGGYVIAPAPEGGYAWLDYSNFDGDWPGEGEECGEIPAMPGWLLTRLLQLKTAKVGTAEAMAEGDEPIKEGFRNEALTRVAGLFRQTGMANGALFHAVNGVNQAQCRPPLSADEVRVICESIGRKPADPARVAIMNGAAEEGAAILAGWGQDAETARKVELDELRAAHSADGAIVDPGPWPESLFELPGIGGDLMRYAEETAHRWQPALALGSILVGSGAVIGRHVQSATGAKANIYGLGVAESGAGKERPRQVMKQTLIKAAVDDRVMGAEDLASEAGLVKSVQMKPAQVMMIDELAFLLKAANDPKSGAHLHGIIGSLLRLYSSSNTNFRGKAYADESKNPVIHYPHCCLWGTTTPGKLYDSLTEDAVDNGLLGRCLLFEVDDHRPEKRIVKPMEPPQYVCDVIRQWVQGLPTGMQENETARTVPLTGEAERLYRAFDVEAEGWDMALEGHACRPLAVRLAENAAKLALVHAWWVDPTLREIGAQSMRWGCLVADYCTRRMAWAVSQHVASNELEKMRQKVYRLIHGTQMAGITNRDIVRRTGGINKVTREHILGDLVEAGSIVMGDGKSPKGRKVKVYRAIDFVV